MPELIASYFIETKFIQNIIARCTKMFEFISRNCVRKEMSVDKDRHVDNRQHFIRIKYKSFTLPNKAELNPSVYVFLCRIFDGSSYRARVCQERERENGQTNTQTHALRVPTVNNTNCIGCIQLYYIRIEIAGLKFNLSFKTNCLFLRRKLFQFYVLSFEMQRNTRECTSWYTHSLFVLSL